MDAEMVHTDKIFIKFVRQAINLTLKKIKRRKFKIGLYKSYYSLGC